MYFQNPVFCRKLGHSGIFTSDSDIFTSDSDIFSHIVAYLKSCERLAYSESCHVQNAGIFKTQDILRTLPRDILAYSERCVTLVYLESYLTQNFAILRVLTYLGPEAYSEPSSFRNILAYLIMIVIITLTSFSRFNLTYISTKLKKKYFLTTMTSISMIHQ